MNSPGSSLEPQKKEVNRVPATATAVDRALVWILPFKIYTLYISLRDMFKDEKKGKTIYLFLTC